MSATAAPAVMADSPVRSLVLWGSSSPAAAVTSVKRMPSAAGVDGSASASSVASSSLPTSTQRRTATRVARTATSATIGKTFRRFAMSDTAPYRRSAPLCRAAGPPILLRTGPGGTDVATTDLIDGAALLPDGRVAAGRQPVTIQLPRLRDPRLHVAAVLLSVQVLGQVSLGFDLSVAQILVTLATAGAIEALLTARRTRVIAWPASALLTGNGIALILRVPGTEHGDWWSLRGWYVFAATAALAVLSKYVIRVGDRPLFNPSNLALVAAFLILGERFADPQDLWWGPMSPGLALTYALIVVGGLIILRRLGLLAVSAAFGSVFAALVGVLAVSGHAMTARWHLGPVVGWEYWTTLVLSPEVLIFVFFMITDPRTAARGRTAGCSTAPRSRP